jgi:hypothetical protein
VRLERLREKLPEIALEAGSVVFAVLLALAVDECRDDRANRRLAQEARQAILTEMRANRDELRRDRERLAKQVAALPPDEELQEGLPAKVRIELAFSRLSSGAWQAAQATKAAQHFDYAWMIRAARVHETQALYLTTQAALIQYIGGAIAGPSKLELARGMRSRWWVLQVLTQELVEAYNQMLDGR